VSTEQLRIEFKLDLIIRTLQHNGLMLKNLPQLEGLEQDSCPICEGQIRIEADLETETLKYTCSCRAPKTIVTGISALFPPRSTDVHAERDPAEEVPPEQPPPGGGRG
jgi:hypothetical protein